MSESNANKKSRASQTRWLPISELRVSPRTQREYKPAQAEEYAADFDLEALGFPVVNHRDGHWYIVDGQHRVGALKLIGWGDQQIECEAYEGLTEAEEAELFLKRDRRRPVRTLDKFRIGITAQRPAEVEMNKIVQGLGLKISEDGSEGSIAAVSAVQHVYASGGSEVLHRTLRVLRDAYPGDSLAFRGEIIKGVGLVCQRYNGSLPDDRFVATLSTQRGGAGALLRKTEILRRQLGAQKPHCVAGAIVDLVNAGRGGKKIKDWWS